MRPLHWQVLATHIPPGGSLGGIVRYTTELIGALVERDDVVVSAVTTRAAADTVRDLVGDGEVRLIPDLPTPLLSVAERHLSTTRGTGPDVVHGMKHLLPRRSPALKVLTVHDMLLLDRASDFAPTKRVLLPGSYRASIRAAELLVCVSDATRARVEAHVPGSSARAQVVHLATSSALLGSAPTPVQALAGRRFALVVGDATTRKNLRTVVAAWADVRERVPDAVLAVAGPPSWGRTEVGATFDELTAAGSLVVLGHVEDSALRWCYENAQVVLCPSLAEGFGLPAAEALDLGAPVIISEDAALQEVCAGRARAVLPARRTDLWADAIVTAFSTGPVRPKPPAPEARQWSDVAEETVRAVKDTLARRGGA